MRVRCKRASLVVETQTFAVVRWFPRRRGSGTTTPSSRGQVSPMFVHCAPIRHTNSMLIPSSQVGMNHRLARSYTPTTDGRFHAFTIVCVRCTVAVVNNDATCCSLLRILWSLVQAHAALT